MSSGQPSPRPGLVLMMSTIRNCICTANDSSLASVQMAPAAGVAVCVVDMMVARKSSAKPSRMTRDRLHDHVTAVSNLRSAAALISRTLPLFITMSTIADSYLTDYINPDTDNQRKWVYWAPVQRLDTIFAYINRNYWNAPENCWRVDMEGFRMGMAMEAVRALYICSLLIH